MSAIVRDNTGINMATYKVKERQSGRNIAGGSPDEQCVFKFEGNWYFDPNKVDMTHLRVTQRTYTCPYKGVCFWIDLETPEGSRAQNVAWVYRQPKPGYEMIQDRIGFYARDTSGTMSVVE
jgi:uncharacterized protein (DUF427 family)